MEEDEWSKSWEMWEANSAYPEIKFRQHINGHDPSVTQPEEGVHPDRLKPMSQPEDEVLGDQLSSEDETDRLDEETDSSSNSDDEEDTTSQDPLKDSEKRAAQRAIFKEWMANAIDNLTNPEISNQTKDEAEELQSIATLLEKQENSKITDPRDYQMELYERAKKENTIAVLDTGSGKTLIAVLLLRHILDLEVEARASGESPRIAFFVVNATTLVFQQFSVLHCNLDHEIERICGAMGIGLWSKEVWEKLFKSKMVVVLTADVLHQCLTHSFLKIDQINLIIFDEAHHAKRNHAYARIVRDFYLTENDITKRPRIFGMTASPVDAKVDDIKKASMDLEKLLDSKIATVALTDEFKNTAREYVLCYSKLPLPFETELYTQIKSRFGELKAFSRMLSTSKELTSTTGRWGADYFWSFALTEEQAKKVEARVEREHCENQLDSLQRLDSDIALLRTASDFISEYDFGKLQINNADLSSKVLELHGLLQQHFERVTNSRCIVFVDRRTTARILEVIFSKIGGPNLHVGLLTGIGTAQSGDASLTFRKQVVTLLDFRKGKINCLFATSVAEEGLDIPDCNLVVRFDLYKTMIQYVQSKGRARHRNSKFIDMAEADNLSHHQAITDARVAARLMVNWCQSLDEDRVLNGNSADGPHDEVVGKVFVDPQTGAKLTYDSSLAVLAHFVAALPQHDDTTACQPHYVMKSKGKHFKCEVILPAHSPVTSVIGQVASNKATAKRSAAWEMCILLRKGKYLDEYLLPIYSKQLPAMRNAQLALSSKKSNSYPMRLKPKLWEIGHGTTPTELFLTVLDINGKLDRPHQPLGLLSRTPLPKFPQFSVFPNIGDMATVTTQSVELPLSVDEEMLTMITKFTLLVYLDIFNKEFEFDISKMSYWIVPLHPEPFVQEDPYFWINWAAIELVSRQEDFPWVPSMSHEFLKNKFLVDRYDGARRFFSKGVDLTKNPLDPVPRESVKGRYMKNILDYSISLYKKARVERQSTWAEDQPVLEVEQALFRRNMLAKPERKERGRNTKAWVCAQPLKISTITPEVATTCLVFPAIIHRLEDYMISLEATDIIGIKVDATLALEAMTKDSDNSGAHQEEVINFRAGMGPNYERLEFMGDCFLKMATSISLFGQNPNNDEFEFHVKRMCLICNKNLFNTALELTVYEYVRSMAFSRRTWYPEGIKMLRGKGAEKIGAQQPQHSLGDKTVADVCEALIGAAFIQYNDQSVWRPENWDAAVKAVSVLVNNPDHNMLRWQDYSAAYEIPGYQTAATTAEQRDLAAKTELEHPYHFKWPRLLRSAFNHPSNPSTWGKVPSYQRLEFLGDSLLDTACVTYLFYRYPGKDPQWLTEHKMAMVSNRFFGALCVKIGFYRHLRHNNSQLEYQVRDYVTEIQEAERESNGAVDYWTSVKDPPKCLPDIVESYVGAIFIDSDFNYAEVQRFFDMHIQPFFADMSIYDNFANNHPTTLLHSILTIELGCRDYRLMSEEVPQADPAAPSKVVAGLMVHSKMVAHAIGVSGRYAKVRASTKGLDMLRGLAPFEFRARFGCDCGEEQKDDKEGENTGIEQIGTAI